MDHHTSRGVGSRVSANPRNQSPTNDESIAIASDVFDHFCTATTLKSILGLHRNMCDLLKLRPTNLPNFYPKLKSKLRSWKANALWKRLDIRANHKCYNRGRVGASTRVLVIGAGPCGLRTAIECQLLGAKVVVTEKRDRLSRNNVLHLWPFVINDLRALGAKKFFGKFCAGAIDHISIRQLQCILLKIALLLGVEFHEGVSFENLIEPTIDATERHGWRAEVIPQDHPVSQYEFDILIGADGKRNTLHGFKRKEFRGKLAIAITANFINKHSEAEARVQEISGVAFIFNQKFFKDLYQETGIDLENIVYYKDETHYFVMTAKKHSLINKGVIVMDLADTAKLLAPENVDREALMKYAREAAEFSTKYQMPNLEFAVNHYGQPDVAMFDFTSMYAAENASRVIERNGHRLLLCLVGDSLLEPFWPTGSGCARGFLSSLDAGWAVRSWALGDINPLEILAERESIYRLLGQTTPENLQRDYAAYTLNPTTRYPNLNRFLVTPIQVKYLYDTDNPERVELPLPKIQEEVHKKKRRREVHPDTLLHWIQKQVNAYNLRIDNLTHSFKNGLALCAIIHRYHPELVDWGALDENNIVGNNQLAFDLLEKECGVPPVMTGIEMAECTVPDKLTMLSYLSQIYETFHGEIPQTIKHSKIDLKDLKKEYSMAKIRTTTAEDWNIKRAKAQAVPSASNAITPRLSGKRPTRLSHLASSERRRKRRSGDKVADRDRDRYQDYRQTDENTGGRVKNLQQQFKQRPQEKKPPDLLRAIGKIESSDWHVREIEKKILENKLGKPKTAEKEKVPKWSREQFMARQSKMEKKSNLERTDSLNEKYMEIDKSIKLIDKKLKEGSNLEQGERGNNKVASMAEHFDIKPVETPVQKSKSIVLNLPAGSEMCHFCGTRVYLMERLSAEGQFFHRGCFRCQYCSITLRLGFYHFDAPNGKFYCPQHANMQGKTRNIRQEKDALDSKSKGRTPERIEFANLHESENEEAPSQMDEDEWTDRNFGQSTAEVDSSDLSDSDSDDLYEEALERAGEVPTKPDGPRLSYVGDSGNSEDSSDDESSSYYDYSSDEDAKDSETDDEEIKMAREIRRKEFNVRTAAPQDTDTTTGSDTEVLSESEETETSNESRDSATEISTDSEFKLDGTTPTVDKPFPAMQVNDAYICKTRGGYHTPKKVQIERRKPPEIVEEELILPPLVPDIATLAPLKAPLKGFFSLNRTHSTEGIASKVSLELKKQYLFGTIANNIQKSGSASMLDSSKLKSFHNNITEQQKLLNPPKLPDPIKHICCLNTPKSDSDDAKLTPKVESQTTDTTTEKTVIPTIEVPEWNESTSFDDVDTDSLSSFDDKNYQELSHNSSSTQNQLNVPKVQINDDDMAMDSLLITTPITPPPAKFEWISPRNTEPKVLNPPKVLRRKSSSELSSSERDNGGVLTETELSDWARDENVSADDFEDVEMKIDYEHFDSRKQRAKAVNHFVKLGDLDQHVCGKTGPNEKEEESSLPSHLAELDSIEYMDTISEDAGPCYETINSATNVAMLKNQGYVQFVNTQPQDLKLTPKLPEPEPTPPPKEEKPSPKTSPEKPSPEKPPPEKIENTKEEKTEEPEYIEHVQRLQTKITEFGNVKDSIDVRKSKKTSPKKVLTTSEKLQEMAKERNKQKNLIHEMVLEKLKSEKRQQRRSKTESPVAAAPPPIPIYATVNKNVGFRKEETFQRSSSINLFSPDRKQPNRTKSFSELTHPDCTIRKSQSSGHVLAEALAAEERKKTAFLRKSEPCLAVEKQRGNEKRKSIIQAVTDFFHKRKGDSPEEGVVKTSRSNSSPGDSSSVGQQQRFSLFRISPKSKEKAKLKTSPPKDSPQKYTSKEENHLVKSQRDASPEAPPPVPPLPPLESCDPLLYDRTTWSSLDTLDCSAGGDNTESLDQRKQMRRSQHKRLRIAQEVQRKLEETEVKTKELEARGVELEKKLRGEDAGGGEEGADEYGLLTEWLTLMRELAALRRYERELMTRAEDVRLEERHSLLQSQRNEPEVVDQIIDIAEKRKSLALMLEKNNQSYVKEDNDLEALMLQKGLQQLTSVQKSSTPPKK